MDVRELVIDHYGDAGLAERILAALSGAGVDTDDLAVRSLSPVDQLHAGFAPATDHLLDMLDVDAEVRLLDVGCGIGGPARVAASRGAAVTGVDLTPEFVEAATELTARVGLGDRATFRVTSADQLPFEDASFDAAMMIHVGMNVPDKAAVFTEVRRVLEPGGRFALFEQMRTGDGELPYPMPWAVDERSSFVESQEQYEAHLASAGFTVETVENRTAAIAGPPPSAPGGPSLSPMVLFGPDFGIRIDNNIAATVAGQLGAILMIARAS